MVLELLLNPFTLKKKPWQIFIAGFFNSLIAVLLSYIVFREVAGILMVFLVVISTLPIIYMLIKHEEELEIEISEKWQLLKEHTKVITYLILLFFGILFAFFLAYVFLPQSMTQSIFLLQEKAITKVNSDVQAQIIGNITRVDIFGRIFLNNMKVLVFCLLFSLLYGTGAVFILTWNASVVAAAMGNIVKIELAKAASIVGYNSLSVYFGAATFSFFRYMIHGFFEVAAYFVAGLAGGILSIAFIKHNFRNDKILIDVLDLILISVSILLFAAFVEVYITPSIL